MGNGMAKGMFLYSVMIVDSFSRSIVGWEVFGRDSVCHVVLEIERAVLAGGRVEQPLVLRTDGSSPFARARPCSGSSMRRKTPRRSTGPGRSTAALLRGAVPQPQHISDYQVDGSAALYAAWR
jgi:hypothetical protein